MNYFWWGRRERVKDSLIEGDESEALKGDPEFKGGLLLHHTHMGSNAPRAAHTFWKEKPMLQYLITALLRALNLECVDLFGRHYRCTNACLVRWMEDRESFYEGF